MSGIPFIEGPLYTAGISLYRFGVRVAGLGDSKARQLDRGQADIWPRLRKAIQPGDRVIWIHAASLGEFEQGRPLMEMIKRVYPQFKIVLTFFSPSGYEIRKDYKGADCVTYLPFDTPYRVHNFLDKVNPEMAIFVKYEIWRNYLHELKRRNIPTYLISAAFRPNQKFFNPMFSWYADWLRFFDRLYVQDEQSKRLLAGIGIDNVEVTGDTRFDRVAEIRQTRRNIPVLERFTQRDNPERKPVMMAGSSWESDEDVYVEWFNRHPEVKLVIAPHEFNRERLQKLLRRFENGAILMSEVQDKLDDIPDVQVLIMDCFGLLSSAYGYCDVAYVGGGFGAGIHNINEPAVYEIPVIFGPNNSRFIEAEEMTASGGAVAITGRSDFEAIADELFDSSQRRGNMGAKAGAYIRSKLGATEKVFRSLFATSKTGNKSHEGK